LPKKPYQSPELLKRDLLPKVTADKKELSEPPREVK
jgi:hypothetical protein